MIEESKCNLRIKLRPAVYNDVNIVLSWRNESATVLNMKTKRVLNFQEHNHWFKKTIIDPKCVFLIIESEKSLFLKFDLKFRKFFLLTSRLVSSSAMSSSVLQKSYKKEHFL